MTVMETRHQPEKVIMPQRV